MSGQAKKEKADQLDKSSGGYMSVDREQALNNNWDILLRITRALVKPDNAQKKAAPDKVETPKKHAK